MEAISHNFKSRDYYDKTYERGELLGKGGFGEVWKVTERKTGKIYAAKYLTNLDNDAKEAFINEYDLMAHNIDHKNLLKVEEAI